MNTDSSADQQRTDLHRLATQIALSYARCHNESLDAFPNLLRTAYHGLLSCTQQTGQAAKNAAANTPAKGARKSNGHAKLAASAKAPGKRNGSGLDGQGRGVRGYR
jgi:hypothetical protein